MLLAMGEHGDAKAVGSGGKGGQRARGELQDRQQQTVDQPTHMYLRPG